MDIKFFSSISNYLLPPTNELVEPIELFKVVNGFKCDDCPYYCQSKRTMDSHIIEMYHEGITECHVQRLPGRNSNQFFGVLGDIISEPSVEVNSNDLKNILNEMKPILLVPELDENISEERSLFYTKLGWHDLNEVINIDTDFFSYATIPTDKDDLDLELFNLYFNLYKERLITVNEYDITIRFRLTEDNKVFMALSDASMV
jgi:hypothetical protein